MATTLPARSGVPRPHPHHPAPPPHRRSRALPAALAVAVIVAAAAAMLTLRGAGPHRAAKPEDLLLEQFHQAAAGTVVPQHAFGGVLTVAKANGRLNVRAEALPVNACVQVGWRLAREGTVIINGVLPQRISGAVLAQLCALDAKGATLVWAPQ